MKIGVIGGGRVGGALARSWEAAGHDVAVSTRETVPATVAGADVLLLAIPCSAVEATLAAAGPLDGKILIDATNNLSGGPSGAEIAALAPGARAVKAFNTVFAQFFADPPTRPAPLMFAGDDEAAKSDVASLIEAAGFEPVDVGGHDQAAELEAFARLVIGLAYRKGRGPFLTRFEQA